MTDKLKLLKKMTTWATAVLVILSIVAAIVCFIGSQQTVVTGRYGEYVETQTNAAMIVYGIVLLIGGIFGAAFFYVFMLCVIDCFASINVTKAETEQIAVAAARKSASDCKNSEIKNGEASPLT